MRIAALALLAAAAASSSAGAAVPHTVQPGETLWSIAAANGFTTHALAAANGLSTDSQVVLGSTIRIPSVAEAASALSMAEGEGPGEGAADGTGQGTTQGTTHTVAQTGAPPPMGGYIVRPGETLSGIAARSGVSTTQLAWMNGIDPAHPLLSGTALKLPGATSTAVATATPQHVAPAAPYATPGHATSAQISSIAAQHGVPGSLASAVAWQESGFNNGMVSSANARGVMQVMPGTWQWVERNLSGPLDPSSPADNVKAGSLYLRQLLRDTGGNERMAVAAYYQGLGSVQSRGLLPETQRYVDNVMALRSRFGG